MTNVKNAVCVGAQWGDEGKGKITDLLSEKANVVVRFQGGNNAGHTLVVDGVQTVLHLVPSGILHKDKVCVIGNGCVLDPEVLLQELDMLQARKILEDEERLILSDRAHVILPFHKRIDKARELARGSRKIGTTGRGIGPAYEDKVARRGMRVVDLVNPDAVAKCIRRGVLLANSLLDALGADIIGGGDIEEMIERTRIHGQTLKPYVQDTSSFLHTAMGEGKKILFEGAQGAMLDVDHGTFPFVTSSNCLAGHAAVGSGVGPKDLGTVLAVTKAYTTRVGEGPFPTEMDAATEERIRKAGSEFGATTGRSRRCGWLDLVQLKTSIRLNGATELALTKLDVLAGVDELEVCTAYELDGKRIDYLPAGVALEEVVPVYEKHEGFRECPSDLKSLDDLPDAARRYAQFIAESVNCNLALVSVGPQRGEELILRHPFD
ncbi:MAG: adenylosuccinate synthase [Deltaproteobacteria bacterium]|nr:adenylosuccinate synthase [Deltaproteobacteria bacterium]